MDGDRPETPEVGTINMIGSEEAALPLQQTEDFEKITPETEIRSEPLPNLGLAELLQAGLQEPAFGWEEVSKVYLCDSNHHSTLDPEQLDLLFNQAFSSYSKTANTDEPDEPTQTFRFGLIEFCCDASSEVGKECERLGIDVLRVDKDLNALDAETGVICLKFIEHHTHVHIHGSLPCTPWSQLQYLNVYLHGETFARKLEAARRLSLQLVLRFLILCRFNRQCGGTSSFEWPKDAVGWQKPLVLQLLEENEYSTALVDGCSVGVVSKKTGGPIKKPWRFDTDCELLRDRLKVNRCPGNHQHVPCEGGEALRSGFYPPKLAKILVKAVLEHHLRKNHADVQALLMEEEQAMRTELLCSATQEETDAFMKLSTKERTKLVEAARKLHINSGHKPPGDIARLMRKNNSPPASRAAMEAVRCSTCQEHKRPDPSPVVSLDQLEQTPFKSISIDVKEISDKTHKYNYLFVMCNATRFTRTLKIQSFPKGQFKNVRSEEILESLESGWEEIFGVPGELKHDAEGAFVSNEFIQRMSEKGVLLRPIAGEAHWQNGLVERCIQTISASAVRLMSELHVTLTSAMALATSAQNHMEKVHGFSPSQWALGRSQTWSQTLHEDQKDLVNLSRDSHEAFARKMLEQIQARKVWQEEDFRRKVQRAERARHRKDKVFLPGELVYAWRLGSGKVAGTKKTGLHKGAWFGPATVLGTESRLENGVPVPGAIVWIIISDRLWRCAPQQLRRASEREHAQHVLSLPRPWTFENVTRTLVMGNYRDVTGEGNPEDPEDGPVQQEIPEEPEQEVHDEDMPEVEQEPVVKRKRIPLATGNGRRYTKKGRPDSNLEAAINLAQECASMTETAFFNYEQCPDTMLEIEFPLLDHDRLLKKYLKNPEAFVVTSLKKKRVEINERTLSKEDKDLIRLAKGKEVKEFIKEHVVERLKDGEHVDPAKIMRMRWVLTWKKNEDGSKKGKARLVVLGFEDPFLGHETTSSPTLNKRSKQILLQICVQEEWKLLKGDVTAAFLQGRSAMHDKYALAPPELAEALGLPQGERVVRLLKSVYGLTTAPIEWFQKVNDVLKSLGAEQCASDPCVWRYVVDNKLQGLVGAHVDDFLICGDNHSEHWKKFIEVLQTSFRWTPWEEEKFKQCGVLITQNPDGSITQHQEEYLATLSEIDLKKERAENLNSPVTESERTQLRALLGGLQWLVTQTRVDGMIDVNLLQSRVVNATVETLQAANKVLRKLRQGPSKLFNKRIPTEDTIHLVAWSDASWANRRDGKSTGGFLIGLCSHKVLQGERGHVSIVSWGTNKLKRVARSSMSAELQALANAEDELHLCRLAWAEFTGKDIDLNQVDEIVKQVPGTIVIDAKSIYDALTSQNQPLQMAEKRTALELLAYLRNTEANGTQTRWVHGGANLADGLTKLGAHPMLREFLETSSWSLVYDPAQQAGKKRQAKGLGKLENEANACEPEDFHDLAWQRLREQYPEFCESSETDNPG